MEKRAGATAGPLAGERSFGGAIAPSPEPRADAPVVRVDVFPGEPEARPAFAARRWWTCGGEGDSREEMASEELEDAKKEMIRALEQRSGKSGTRSNMNFGVKRMGELDQKAFRAACRNRIAEDDFDVEFTLIFSKWEDEIRQTKWYIDADGKKKEKIQEDDERLQALKAEFGEEAHGLVVKALLEMHE